MRPDPLHSRLWPVLAVLALVAAYFVLFRLGATTPLHGGPPPPWSPSGKLADGRMPAHDTYAYFYPNIIHARHAVAAGGDGLLWNPFQNCGQPFLGVSQTALLYPVHALFFLMNPHRALRAVMFVDLLLAGLFAYLLCRQLGASPIAALAGAFAFELGSSTVRLAAWAPMMIGPYVWLPAAMLACERALQAPSLRRGVVLGLTLAIALLPGYPQTVFFAYQLIALRVLWELARRRGRPLAIIAAVGLGLVLAPLLAAVQLLPAAELARESVRNTALVLQEINPSGFMTWAAFRRALVMRDTVVQPLMLLTVLLAVLGLVRRTTRPYAAFYLATALLYFVLAFGLNTPLFALYMRLPVGRLFRETGRFTWVTTFCLSVLAALGTEAVVAETGRRRPAAIVTGALATLALGAFYYATKGKLQTPEWWLAAAAFSGLLAAVAFSGRARWIAAVLAATVLLNPILVPGQTWEYFFDDDASLFAHRDAFADLRARMTLQDRAYFSFSSPRGTGFALMQKSGSIFRVPSIQDYEPQVSRRYAELFVRLRSGVPMQSVNQMYYAPFGWTPAGINRPLVNLLGTRYLLVGRDVDNLAAVFDPPLRLVAEPSGLRLYENPQALPRAYWVPRVEVVAGEAATLDRLASPSHDPRAVALLDAPPPSGFTGTGASAGGSVDIVRDAGERIVLRITAPARGFLVLTDQLYPGWRATVAGVPQPVLRANHAFRAVEVPAGVSEVEMRYRPRTVFVGAVVTAVTALGALIVLARRRHSV